MNCAIYARFSSEMHRSTSIDDQVRARCQYATAHGWTVNGQQTFTDYGISGSSIDGRPGIQALLSGSERPALFTVASSGG